MSGSLEQGGHEDPGRVESPGASCLPAHYAKRLPRPPTLRSDVTGLPSRAVQRRSRDSRLAGWKTEPVGLEQEVGSPRAARSRVQKPSLTLQPARAALPSDHHDEYDAFALSATVAGQGGRVRDRRAARGCELTHKPATNSVSQPSARQTASHQTALLKTAEAMRSPIGTTLGPLVFWVPTHIHRTIDEWVT